MDIDKIREEIKDRFGSDERAAEIIETIFNGSISKEDAIKEESFLFETTADAEMIMELFNITDYEDVVVGERKMISMNNIRDAATVYYTLTHLEQLVQENQGVCVWCKEPITLFDDQLSESEYKLNGACQNCQNKTWIK